MLSNTIHEFVIIGSHIEDAVVVGIYNAKILCRRPRSARAFAETSGSATNERRLALAFRVILKSFSARSYFVVPSRPDESNVFTFSELYSTYGLFS